MNHQATEGGITNLTMHLLAALNGVVINRYSYDANGDSTLIKKIEVPIRYGYKLRQLEESISVNGTIKFPIIAVSMKSISIDTDRNASKNRDRINQNEWDGSDDFPSYRAPTPVKLTYAVEFATTKHSDYDQIASHYISALNPYISISWKHPFSDEELISKVEWDGTQTQNFPNKLAAEDKARYDGSFNLTLNGWIFKDEVSTVGSINCIEFNIDMVRLNEDVNIVGEREYGDSLMEYGAPDIIEIVPECIEAGKYVTLYGNNLIDVDAIYALPLSGSNFPTSSWNPFCLSQSLSASCPEFRGYQIPEYTVLDNNAVSFLIPTTLSSSEMDIMVTNRHSGCYKLSEAALSGDCIQSFLETF